MGSLFGGAQTVNTGQQTAQAAQQNFSNSSVSAANDLATTLGQQASGQLSWYQQPGVSWETENPISLYQLPELNSTQKTAIAQLGAAGTTGQGLVEQGAAYFPQAGQYIGQGTGLMGQAGQAITPEDINAFRNPFTANVTANLQDIFGQQNMQNLLGSTQAAGGTGGERAAVGQALLAQRQGLTAGNIYADLYQRSLQAAQQQKAQQLAAGQGLVGAGQSIGSLGLQGVGTGVGAERAGLEAGNVQFNRDAQAQALMRNWYAQRWQAPMQIASGMAQIMYPEIGLGQSSAQTGTSQSSQFGLGTGSTTYPAPSPLGGLAGLGLAGASLFAARGGRIKKKHKFDLGGAVDNLEGTPDSDGLMQPQGGLEDAGDSNPSSGPLGQQGQVGQENDPSQQQQTQVPGTSPQDQRNLGPTSQNPQNPYPIPKFIGGQQQQKLANRNKYTLMSALLQKSLRQPQRLPAPQISWPQMRRQEGGRVVVPGLYADGGAVEDDPAQGDDPNSLGLQNMSPMAQAALRDDDDDDVGGEAAPLGGASPPTAQVNQVISPYDTGVNPSVGAPGPNAGGMSPGKLALLQAGLGMMAASGQRDRHGLPMSPMAAIGQGGMQGVNTYQQQQALAQRERASRAALGLRQAQLAASEAHRKTMESLGQRRLDIMEKRSNNGLFDEDTVNMMAEQAMSGDKSVFSNLGRGIQGPQNIAAVRKRMNELAKEQNMSGADIASLNANFTAQTAAARTAAMREANVQTAVNEAKATFPLALDASANLPRKDFVPINQLMKLYREKTSNPAQGRLAVALQGTIIAYSQAMSRTGVNTVHAQERAESILKDVENHQVLEAKLHQMELEMNAALRAPEQTRRAILDKISGKDKGAPLPGDILNPGQTIEPRDNALRRELSGDAADAAKWIKENPNANPDKVERIKRRYGLP